MSIKPRNPFYRVTVTITGRMPKTDKTYSKDLECILPRDNGIEEFIEKLSRPIQQTIYKEALIEHGEKQECIKTKRAIRSLRAGLDKRKALSAGTIQQSMIFIRKQQVEEDV